MTLPNWREEPIAKKHDRASFDCGETALNEFLRRHARQSHDKGAAKTFLAISSLDGKTILGFYSLCPVPLKRLCAAEVADEQRPIRVDLVERAGIAPRSHTRRLRLAL